MEFAPLFFINTVIGSVFQELPSCGHVCCKIEPAEMLGASLGSLQLYFGGPTTANERGGACYSHWNRTSNLHVCNKCCDQMFDSGGLLDFSNLTISSGLHSSTVHYLMSSSVPFLYEL